MYGSGMMNRVNRTDGLVESIQEPNFPKRFVLYCQWLKRCLLGDHGGLGQGDHVDPTDEVMTIPWMAYAPGIRRGIRIESPARVLDTAPTIARLLDMPPLDSWIGRTPEGIFC